MSVLFFTAFMFAGQVEHEQIGIVGHCCAVDATRMPIVGRQLPCYTMCAIYRRFNGCVQAHIARCFSRQLPVFAFLEVYRLKFAN